MRVPPCLTANRTAKLFPFGSGKMRQWSAAIKTAGVIHDRRFRCGIISLYTGETMAPAKRFHAIF
jgi:hypothetical protein